VAQEKYRLHAGSLDHRQRRDRLMGTDGHEVRMLAYMGRHLDGGYLCRGAGLVPGCKPFPELGFQDLLNRCASTLEQVVVKDDGTRYWQ
jgi:hypothetical protein